MDLIYEKLKHLPKGSTTLTEDFFLYQELVDIGKDLGFSFDRIQLVHNVALPPHKDKGVKGCSMCISCGNYTGGELVVGGVEYNAYHNPIIFDGVNIEHYNKPIHGDKFSIVYWTKV